MMMSVLTPAAAAARNLVVALIEFPQAQRHSTDPIPSPLAGSTT
jgi:hypothetical protein